MFQPLDVAIEEFATKVYHEPVFQVGQLQVCQHLLLVNSGKGVERFQFDEDGAFHNERRLRALIEAPSAKLNRNGLLPLDGKAALGEDFRQRFCVNRIEKSGSDSLVNFNCAVNHARGDAICVHFK